MKMVLIFVGLVALLGAVVVVVALMSGVGSAPPANGGHGAQAALSAPPKDIDFPALMGHVTFDHALHSQREKDNCKACHDKLFPQSKDPLNYKAAMHQTAETAKASCGGCHNPSGPSFVTKGNCAKCHLKT